MPALHPPNLALAKQLRERFVEQAVQGLADLPRLLQEQLLLLVDQSTTTREMQDRRDAWLAVRDNAVVWIEDTARAWQVVVAPQAAGKHVVWDSSTLALLGDDVVEDKILASRLALRIVDLAGLQFNDLRLRVQHLDGSVELAKDDILQPDTLAKNMLEQWTLTPLSRQAWLMVQDVLQQHIGEHLAHAYHEANAFLIEQGVMPEIDLRPLIKRSTSRSTTPGKLSSSLTRPGALTAPIRLSMGEPGPGGGASGSSAPATAAARQAVHEETQMQTGTTPLARARGRAQGMLGKIKRLLPDFETTQLQSVSPQLAQTMVNIAQADVQEPVAGGDAGVLAHPDQVASAGQVQQVAGALRQRTHELKHAATTASEKAVIEIVALMFQSILAEERIAPAIRVWFARLQMPVLRVAIAEPEFFDSLQHPARRLIDRMGSCVLGFDATIAGGALQAEVKRVVQMIEQYPETGRRVFSVAHDEFQKFLAKFLTEHQNTARAVGLAQQVEQKETLVIQYTIELRNMMHDIPVRDEIRDFLFKVWAEVLAIASMQHGPQHERTIKLKQAVADLIWAASAKPDRKDRAQVMADFPKQLELLRQGMTLLGLETAEQELYVKSISETLADAFMSRTELIQPERIAAMAKRLANLEDYLSDESVADLQIDGERLVTMVGLDGADIQVITDGGSQPSEAMIAWVGELELGAWFGLEHNGQMSQVQLAWCSERKKLYSFSATDGSNFLIQAQRVAAYLQAGLLVPSEDEALTVRATRDALSKLDANPERLLS